ncbi:transcription factor MYB3R-1 [Artemisia annua]|uniref:Transcription factor MYB3R-1 n=1 Tax=Artemisia annua TaxID=35608 RepID=A0A2U1N4T7_ARTAN|nr:transcription factor MYB3R-1 [Artemisia annua]
MLEIRSDVDPSHKFYGNKWTELTKFLPGRTDNAIKNHWNISLRKKLDAYIESGMLEQFQGFPSVVIQSTPTTSSRTQTAEDLQNENNPVLPRTCIKKACDFNI